MIERIVKLCVVFSLVALAGCNPLTVHKVATTVLDGVPSLPSPEQYCEEYHENKLKETELIKSKNSAGTVVTGSVHPPYGAKQCDRCHDKNKEGGLILPRDQLCFHCHPKIISKPFVHGPAAVGGCLQCHDPHSSSFPSLLKVDNHVLCASCHKEKRMAEAMHDKVVAKNMLCTDCHSPHAGDVQFFLR